MLGSTAQLSPLSPPSVESRYRLQLSSCESISDLQWDPLEMEIRFPNARYSPPSTNLFFLSMSPIPLALFLASIVNRLTWSKERFIYKMSCGCVWESQGWKPQPSSSCWEQMVLIFSLWYRIELGLKFSRFSFKNKQTITTKTKKAKNFFPSFLSMFVFLYECLCSKVPRIVRMEH